MTDRLVDMGSLRGAADEGSDGDAVDLRVLFEPQWIGSLQIPSRLVMAPMGTCLDVDGHITDAAIAYYVRRARGGVGTITVEGCLVSQDSVGAEPRISSREFLPGLSRLASALRDLGVVAGVQLLHPGRQVVDGPSVAPSAVPLNSAAPVPKELSETEIETIVEDYARAASLALEAGFQYVEVHGAHGYLLSNFLSPLDNRRQDRFGGDLPGRARFSLDVAAAIGVAVGARIPLVWRINGDDAVAGGFAIDEAVEVGRMLESAGVAALSVSAGTWHTLHVTLAPMFVPRGQMLPLAARMRSAVEIPVMAAGRLDDPKLAARAIEAGEADMICIGRGLIAEPDWAEKVRTGRLEELRPCIACNACVDLVGIGERARCAVNPEVGREREWKLEKAPVARDVMVVGSGPAGMEAARVAQLRGHRVSLWERDLELGGKLEVASLAPSKGEVLRFRDFQARVLTTLGVDIHTSVEVTPKLVEERAPDTVVVAIGADPLVPPIPGLGGNNVHDALALLRGEVAVEPGSRIAIVGGSATGCETAELAAAAGAEVAILELRGSIGAGIESITRRRLVRALRAAGVQILTGAKVVMVEPDQVLYEDTGGIVNALPTDLVGLAVGWRPGFPQLAESIQAAGFETLVLGDALEPADFVHAVNAGADAGLKL